MAKQVIKLTESDLHHIIKESVKKIIKELKASSYLDASDKAYDEMNDDNLPRGKREIRKRQYEDLKDYGIKRDREERGITPEDWRTYYHYQQYDKLPRKTLKACDAHQAEREKRK